MVQPAVSDAAAALLAFSESFKKIRRADTVKHARCARQGNTADKPLMLRKCMKIRSTSLPNPKNLYIIVRDNDRKLLAEKARILEKAEIRKCRCRRNRFNSLMPPLISSNGYLTNDFLIPYSQPNGSVTITDLRTDDNATNLLNSNLMSLNKLIQSGTMEKRLHAVS